MTYMNFRWFFFLIVVVQMSIPTYLSAINGIDGIGFGPRNRAMAGANGAAPVDSSTMMINPAGLTRLPTSCDMGADFIIIDPFMDTSHATGPIVNVPAGKQHAKLKYYLFPFTGAIYHPECSRFSIGISSIGVGGGGATYKNPRTSPSVLFEPNETTTVAETGAIFDTSSSAQIIQTSFSAAYQCTNQLSIGVSPLLNTFFFSSDSAISRSGRLIQTNGRGRLDVLYGIGFNVGGLYEFCNNKYAVGLAYTSTQWFQKSKLYPDLIPRFRLPQQVRLGFAYRPLCPLLLTLDVKWIGWKTVDGFGRSPVNGGLGWHDQCAVGAGLQYTISRSLICRTGYNYGKAPIDNKVVFANAMIPVFVEHHLGLGLEYFLNARNSFAVSYVYDFRKTFKDNGRGDLVSRLGEGIRVSSQNQDIAFVWTLKL